MKKKTKDGLVGLAILVAMYGGCTALFTGNEPEPLAATPIETSDVEPDPASEVPDIPPGAVTLSGYIPWEPDERLTPAQKYRADIAFNASGMVARETVMGFDADLLYSELRPSLCAVLADTSTPLATLETATTDQFRRNGIDEIAAGKIATALVDVTSQPGTCP